MKAKEELTPIEHRQVWLDGRFHHCIIFEKEDADDLRPADFEPKTRLPRWRTWTGPLFLGRHSHVGYWQIIDADDTEKDSDLAENELGLLVPRLFWDVTHCWVDESEKLGYFYLLSKE